MNCFDWQNRASDYLDGALPTPQREEADEHLSQCQDCLDRYRHYRILVDTLSSQPRSSLPVPIRRAPMSAPLPRRGISFLRGLQWSRLPWHLRTPLEGLALLSVVFSVISAAPRIREFYQRRLARDPGGLDPSFEDFTLTGSEHVLTSPPSPVAGTSSAEAEAFPHSTIKAPGQIMGGDESAGPLDDDSAPDGPDKTRAAAPEIRVGDSEIWRFILKTDNPAEMRGHIVRLLTDLGVPPSTVREAGIEVPGGIEFDLIVPQGIIPDIKRKLQGLAPPAPREFAKTPASETFTWYKSKSRTPVPKHRSRLVIWISQI